MGYYQVGVSFAGSANYTSASTTAVILIVPATAGTAVIALDPVIATYNGQGVAASAEAYGANGFDLGPAMISYSLNAIPLAPGALPTDAGTYSVTAYYPGATGYSTATVNSTLTINPATPSMTLNPVTFAYDGNPHAATGEVYGVSPTDLGPATISYSLNGAPVATPTDAGVYTVTATYPSTNPDYNSIAAGTYTTTLTITQATPTITLNPVNVTYDGSPQSVTAPGVIGVNGAIGSATISYTLNGTSVASPTDAGVYTVTATFAGNTDYTSASATATWIIEQATPTITMNPVTVIYNGQPQLAAATASGLSGSLSSALIYIQYSNGATPVNPGTYTALATFVGNQDYSPITALTTVTITQATATITLSPATVTYNGSAQGVTAEAFSGNVDLGPALIAYNGSGIVPVNAGTYTVVATYAGNADYAPTTAMTTLTISPAAPSILAYPVSVTYDEQAHGDTAEVYGVTGEDLGPATISYSLGGVPLTPGAAPTDAGTYTVTAAFTASGNYSSGTAMTTITIAQAAPVFVVSPVSVTYDGQAHAVTAGVFGLEGEPFGAATVTYSTSDGSVPVHAGTYTATVSFAGNTDYAAASVRKTVTIAQATPTIAMSPVSVTFDGTAHAATAEVFGPFNADLGPATVTYSGNGLTPIHAGTYIATATFAGNSDYTPTSATALITINPAPTTIVMNAVTVTYDGQPQGAAAEAYGVVGQDQTDLGAASVAYNTTSGAAPVDAGMYTATATTPAIGDYAAASTTTSVTIQKATPTISLSPLTVTANGQPQTAAAEVFGVSGADLGPATIMYSSGSAPSAVGMYTVYASFGGNTDYNSVQVSTSLQIVASTGTTLTPTLTIKPLNVTYNGEPESITANVYGLLNSDLGPAKVTYNTPNGYPPVDVGVWTATATYSAPVGLDGLSYLSATAKTTITITQATPTFLYVPPPPSTFNGQPQPVSVEVIGANNADLGPATITYAGGTAPINAGTYSFTASFAGSQDYTAASMTGTFTILQATPTIAISPVTGTYNGQPYPVTGEVLDLNGAILAPATITYPGGSAPVNPGYYVVTAAYTGNQNYTAASTTTSILIYPAVAGTPVIALNPVSATYDGQPHPASAEVYGADGLDLGPATLKYYVNDSMTMQIITTLPAAPTDVALPGTYYTVTASYAGNGDYSSASATSTVTIAKAAPTLNLTPVNVTFNGQAQGASAEVFGVNGQDLGPASFTYNTTNTSAPIHVGAFTATATFTSTNPNYTSASATTTVTIYPATPTIVVPSVNTIYDGSAHGTTGEAFGVNGTDLGPATITYAGGMRPGPARTLSRHCDVHRQRRLRQRLHRRPDRHRAGGARHDAHDDHAEPVDRHLRRQRPRHDRGSVWAGQLPRPWPRHDRVQQRQCAGQCRHLHGHGLVPGERDLRRRHRHDHDHDPSGNADHRRKPGRDALQRTGANHHGPGPGHQ